MARKAGSRSAALWLVAVAALAAAPAFAQEKNASGTLTIDGVSTPLMYAYASPQPGAFDKKKEDIKILLSDVPLSDEARADVFALSRLGREGDAHIVEVTLDAEADPISGGISVPAFNGMLLITGMHFFERGRFDQTTVAGRLYTRDDGPSRSPCCEFRGTTFSYSATFSVAIPRPPTAAEIATAIASPAGVTASRYLDALRTGQLPALLSTLSTTAAETYRRQGGAARFADLRRDMPRDTKVTWVKATSPTTAVVTVQGHARTVLIEYLLPAVVEAGVWKITN